MMRISVCTFAYNGYGKFIPGWVKNAQKQTYPAYEIIVVLGEKHGLKDMPSGVKFIYHDRPATMGYLKNLAVDAATGDYVFFCAADDNLLENALHEISKVDADIIALKYYDGDKICVTPEIKAEKLPEWRQHYTAASGYIACKNGMRYEDTDWATYPMLFKAFKDGLKFKTTSEPGAIYLHRVGTHGTKPENHAQGYIETEKYLRKYGLIPGNGNY